MHGWVVFNGNMAQMVIHTAMITVGSGNREVLVMIFVVIEI